MRESDESTKLQADADKLQDEIIKAEEDYAISVEKRADAIYKSFAMFDEVKAKEEISTATLKENLEAQVKELESWANNLETLAKKGIDEGFLQELRQMGPQSNDIVSALAKSSDAELNNIVKLWGEKHRLAKEAAVKELEGLRKETDEKVRGLSGDIEKILTSDDFMNGQRIQDEFKALGEYTVDGLLSGIDNKKQEAYDKGTELGQSVLDGYDDALDINSPSLKMQKRGIDTGKGAIIGLDKSIKPTEVKSKELAEAVEFGFDSKKLDLIGKIGLPTINADYGGMKEGQVLKKIMESNYQKAKSSVKNISNEYSRTMNSQNNPNITLNYYGEQGGFEKIKHTLKELLNLPSELEAGWM